MAKSKKKRGKKPPKPVVEIRKLSVKFDRLALRKVSWTIKKGEQWVLLGANGSGKTTLLMAIAGYVLGIYAGLGCAWMLGALGG